MVIQLTPGQASDCAQFELLYQALPTENVLASAALDKGHDTNAIRARLSEDGIEPVIPRRANRIEPITPSFTLLAFVHICSAFISARN